MSREFDELLRQDVERSHRPKVISPFDEPTPPTEPEYRSYLTPRAADQGFKENALFDWFVDRHKNQTTATQMNEAIHKGGATAGGATTFLTLAHLNNQIKPTFELDCARQILKEKPSSIARQPVSRALGLYALGTMSNMAIDQVYFNDRVASEGTTLVDTITPLVLLTRAHFGIKLLTMILPHVATQCRAPKQNPYKPLSW
ncbi:MAG: hypothetical protein IPL73_00375 [Candidatus Obscuribacter sp.]|jgi:hypothetical protein|nr:hypothetical protein [Candidatus Obscuribacter sp.]MBK7839763.1 hypothetical protein [Candidatus Obscuribacter sp.]MBK9200902.1 hypothetical protein [Candidatus Obscuribacter sp.]MBK9621584.1 hypothetical protein [Candidatus Obscuribacter sp.]